MEQTAKDDQFAMLQLVIVPAMVWQLWESSAWGHTTAYLRHQLHLFVLKVLYDLQQPDALVFERKELSFKIVPCGA